MGRPPEHDQAIYQSLRYVLQSEALTGEFHTRMGVTEAEVQELLNNWPLPDERLPDRIAIHNA